MKFIWISFLGLCLLSNTQAYKILFFHDSGTRSHLNLYFPLIEELLDRGHTVTGAFYASANIKHANYTEIVTRDLAKEVMKMVSSIYMEESSSSKYGLFNPRLIMKFMHIIPEYLDNMVELYKTDEVKNILNKKYDVVISASPSAGFVAEMLDTPIILLSPPGPMSFYTEIIGNRFYPSLYPTIGVNFDNPELFSQRLLNLVSNYGFSLWVRVYNYAFESRLQKELNYSGPSIIDACVQRAQLLLSNSHFITHDPQPFLENVIHVGGLHIRKPKPLPADLQNFLDSHPEGVVYVSFGSSITPSSMKEDKKMAFIRVFEKLGNPIIWKWDDDNTEDIPKNVLVKKWLPQQDLLNHPNLKVFVTHGGLLSVMEAIHTGTLLVGIPLANDQRPNLIRMEEKNLAVMVDFDQLDEQVLTEAIQRAMTDTNMKESMIKTSQLFKDIKEPPVKKAAWWVEYTIRNNGTAFLQPLSKDLVWYKAMNLDIICVMLLVIFIVLYMNYLILRTCYRCCCGRKKTKVE